MIQRTYLICLITLLTMTFVLCQELPTDSLVTFEIADTPPKPIGGMEAVYKWLSEQKSKTIFNQTDTLDCSTFRGGIVLVEFIVQRDGKLSNINIAYGLGEPYDSYCLELVEQLPISWQPGIKDGLPINVLSALPFSFCNDERAEAQQKKRRKKN